MFTGDNRRGYEWQETLIDNERRLPGVSRELVGRADRLEKARVHFNLFMFSSSAIRYSVDIFCASLALLSTSTDSHFFISSFLSVIN